ncbi:hypothetical protein M3Y97_00024400 [Aphelenchoides bicaudatus]|nr:hypothetical protein M3Y97_00024400 [Aphelenchoides bicaudatus]
MSGDNSVPEKRPKHDDVITRTGYFEFPSASIAQIVYHSFAHDEDAPRAKGEKQLNVDGNRINFVISASNQKTLNRTFESIEVCVKLSQEVINTGSTFGGNLSDEEKQGISKPITAVFT